MTNFRQCVASVVTMSALGAGSVILAAAPAEGATVVVRIRGAVADLPVATETRGGYERARFRHWLDANHDCQATRAEVLVAESRTTARGCDIVKGTWVSYYDRKSWTRASDADNDGVVCE